MPPSSRRSRYSTLAIERSRRSIESLCCRSSSVSLSTRATSAYSVIPTTKVRRAHPSSAKGQLRNGVFSPEQRCSFFFGERSVLRGSVRTRVRRAYIEGGIVETRGNDGGTGDRFRKGRDRRNRKHGLRVFARVRARCAPDD